MEPYTRIIENTWLPRGGMLQFGWGNGYVHIPLNHPWYNIDHDNIDCDIHGGLTFSEMQGGEWVIGFDTAHYMDSLERWPKEAVQAEADRLLEQVIQAAKL